MVTSVKRKKKSQEKEQKSKIIKIDPMERLRKLISANYFVTFDNCSTGELISVQKFIQENLNVNEFSFVQEDQNPKKQQKFLAFNSQVDIQNKSEHFGVIIGPNAETEIEKVNEFYRLWGKTNCQLRRFQNGETHETVPLNNPSGILYVILVKLKHLAKIHFPNLNVKFHHFDEDFRAEALQSHEKLLETRRIVQDFCHKLRESCGFGTEIPLRKVEAISKCLYKGDLKQNYHIVKSNESISNNDKKIVMIKDGNLHLREKSNMVPSKLNSLPVELEITQKSAMSTAMFARLKMAYAIKLRDIIQEKHGWKTLLCQDAEILVIFQALVFRLKIKPPKPSEATEFSKHALQENLSAIAMRNSNFSGLCQVVSHWLNSHYLSVSIEESVIDSILGTLYIQNQEDDILSIENGFLRFLHLLSFTKFEENFLMLGPAEEFDGPGLTQFRSDFKTKRPKFPPLTIISKNDMESKVSKNLTESYLVRLVNCARSTLHQLSESMNFDEILNEKIGIISEDTFDAVLVLNPFQIPTDSKFGKCENPSVFPVVDYDPVKEFWTEIYQAFGAEVQFYFNTKLWRIGVKFSDRNAMKTILEDIQIIGKDLIKEVILQ